MRNENHSNRRLKVLILAALLMFGMIMIPQSSAQAETPQTFILPMEDWVRNDDVGVIRLVNMLLEEEVPVMWALESFTAGGVTYPAGTFYFQTPFTTRLGVSSAATVAWLMVEAKAQRVWRIDVTNDVTFTANSKELVLPRLCVFYDTSTYLNALVHYQRFQSLGFKVILANAYDIYSVWWNATGSALSQSNVFVMPGGALHLWSFPYGAPRGWGKGNITEFVRHGGGYVSTCAGTTEALMNTPYEALDLINASYSHEWFDNDEVWTPHWRTLIGPISLNVEVADHPVMFGYGPTAVRPGYDQLPIYYYGGPAIHDIGTGVTVLATFGSPITQVGSEIVEDIWGSAAIVTGNYELGRFVSFSPHPEWPGPGARIYAQALFHVAQQGRAPHLDPSSTIPASITAERVNAITSTVSQIKPILENTMRTATTIVNLRAGDHYNALGLWYDSTMTQYAHDVYEQLNGIQRDAVRFQYEFVKLNVLKTMVTDPVALALIDEAQGMIESWFYTTENLPAEPHPIATTDWTGMGPFMPFEAEDEATTFSELVSIFQYVDNETTVALLPLAQEYRAIMTEFEQLWLLNQTAPTPEISANLIELHDNITASWPAGPMYVAMYSFMHTCKIFQYKIDMHLLNIITVGDRTREILSFVDHALAGTVGAWSYTLAELQAFAAVPGAGFL